MEMRNLLLIFQIVNLVSSRATNFVKKSNCDCEVDPIYRIDCGFDGITESGCINLGCCWNTSNIEGVPWCFYTAEGGKTSDCQMKDETSNIGINEYNKADPVNYVRSCEVDEHHRQECGYYGINEQQCINSGCCWAESKIHGVPWCFNSHLIPITTETSPSISPKTTTTTTTATTTTIATTISTTTTTAAATTTTVTTTTTSTDSTSSTTPTSSSLPPTNGIRIMFEKPKNWKKVNLWAWDDKKNIYGDVWPGKPIPKAGRNWYYYDFDESITNINIIFNDGNVQTNDIFGISKSTCFGMIKNELKIKTCPSPDDLSNPNLTISDEFFKNYPRAEIFKLLDNQVPTFKITIPAKVFSNIKGDYFNYESKLKTKDASLTVEMNDFNNTNVIEYYKKVTFSLGGNTSRNTSKSQFNIVIHDENDLHGRRHLKLRSDSVDASLMKTKIISDIYNRLGIPSLSANYVSLYINGEYMGLYILTDRYKSSWIEYVYGEKNTSSLFKCGDFTKGDFFRCINDKDSENDSEYKELVSQLENAKTVSDLEKIVDVEQLLKEFVIEYLFFSYDHFHDATNYYIYKPSNKPWQYLVYDFDMDFGTGKRPIDITIENYVQNSYINGFLCFDGNPTVFIIRQLVNEDSKRVIKILQEIVADVFNPSILYPHIDKIKNLIYPYVELDKKDGPNGYWPGRFNERYYDRYTFEQWEENCEYTDIDSEKFNYGIKHWILEKYRYVCNQYNIECDPDYMDPNFE